MARNIAVLLFYDPTGITWPNLLEEGRVSDEIYRNIPFICVSSDSAVADLSHLLHCPCDNIFRQEVTNFKNVTPNNSLRLGDAPPRNPYHSFAAPLRISCLLELSHARPFLPKLCLFNKPFIPYRFPVGNFD